MTTDVHCHEILTGTEVWPKVQTFAGLMKNPWGWHTSQGWMRYNAGTIMCHAVDSIPVSKRVFRPRDETSIIALSVVVSHGNYEIKNIFVAFNSSSMEGERHR